MVIHSRLTRILMWFAIAVTSPIVPIVLYFIKVRENEKQVTLLEHLTRMKQINPVTMVRVLLGMLLILLPTIALVMAWVTQDYLDKPSYVFFSGCYAGGVGLIIWAAYLANRLEENDLRIDRSSRVKDTVYESKGTSVKV